MISVAANAGTLSGRNLSASYGSSGRTLPIVYCLMESDASSITPALRSTSSRAFLCSSSYEMYPVTPRPVTNTASNTRLNFRRRPMLCPLVELLYTPMATRGHSSAPAQRLKGNEWRALRILLPYLLEYKWRGAAGPPRPVAAQPADVRRPPLHKQGVGGARPPNADVAVPAGPPRD